MTGSYTWSKSLTDASGNGDNLEESGKRNFNYGPSTFDRRHIFVSTFTYTIPFFRKLNSVGKVLLDGYEVSGIARLQSGQYLTVTGNTSIGGRRADYIGGDINQQGSDPSLQWFNTSVFKSAPDDRRGNAGVGTVVGPGRYLWDFSLRKRFAIREKYKVQFQADLFNAFNRLNLNNPDTNFSSLSFGQINGSAPGRNAQVGLRFDF